MKTKKNKITSLIILVISIFSFVGCSRDSSDDAPPATSTTHKVVFKAEVSAGSSISQATYGYDSSFTSASSLSGVTWSSPEITVPANTTAVSATVYAIGNSASSTIKTQIYVDGVLKKEATGSGEALIAHAAYNLK